MKQTEHGRFQDIYMSVKNHRERAGCDICKIDGSTQCFIGFCGDVLWICGNCFKKITKVQVTEEVQK